MKDNLLTVPTPRGIKRTNLPLDPKTTKKQWGRIGEWLAAIDRSSRWWVGDWICFSDANYGEAYGKETCDLLGLAYSSVTDSAYVAKRFHFSRRRENLSFSHHAEVACLKEKDADEWLDTAETKGWSRNELREAVRRLKRHEAIAAAGALPAGTYNVILADPPWTFSNQSSETRQIENQYPTMDLSDICAMDVELASAEDAVLFLWVPSSMIPEGFEVLSAWGFTYKSMLVWVKDQIGMGWWVRNRHEPLLIASRGSIPPPADAATRSDSVVEAPRGEHSAKPEKFYSIIEAMFPDAQRLELFSREGRDGWKPWGTES